MFACIGTRFFESYCSFFNNKFFLLLYRQNRFLLKNTKNRRVDLISRFGLDFFWHFLAKNMSTYEKDDDDNVSNNNLEK